MIKDTLYLHSDCNTYAEKVQTAVHREEAFDELFDMISNNSCNEFNNMVLETQEKINEYENQLAKLKNKRENGLKDKILSGTLVSLLASCSFAGSLFEKNTPLKETPELFIKLEKVARSIKKPVLNTLFTMGTALAGFGAISAVLIPLFIVLGNENDKKCYSSIEQKLAEERIKLENLKKSIVCET